MPLPKRLFIDKPLYQSKQLNERVDEIMAGSDENSTYLPQAVEIYNIDEGVFNLLESGALVMTGDDGLVPVIMLGNERWAEYGKIWKHVNEDKNLTPPFVTLKRVAESPGTMLGKYFTTPNKRNFTYRRIPTYENGIMGWDLYQIPEPTAIDISYEVRLFTHYITDVNNFVELFLRNYSDRQLYINVHGHYFSTLLEESSNEDTQDDMEGDRYFVKTFKLLCKGYIQNTADMKVVPTVNRIITTGELDEEQLFRISQQI